MQLLLSEFSGVLPAVQISIDIFPVENGLAFQQRLYALQYEFARGGRKALETVEYLRHVAFAVIEIYPVEEPLGKVVVDQGVELDVIVCGKCIYGLKIGYLAAGLVVGVGGSAQVQVIGDGLLADAVDASEEPHVAVKKFHPAIHVIAIFHRRTSMGNDCKILRSR